MKILFLNQYDIDDPSPTARLLRDLVNDCVARGHVVCGISAGVDYRQRPARGWKRWWRESMGLLRIFRDALISRPRPDIIISFSSPPLLNIFAILAARWHGARSIHWALDLYPDLALTLGELRPGLLARLLVTLTRWAYRHTDTVVTLDEDMRDRLRYYWGVNAEIIAPWPPLADESVVTNPTPRACWLYSGNLGRAHDWETMLRIQERIEKQHPTLELIIRGGGASWAQAQAWATEHHLQRCRWCDYADEEKLVETLLTASVEIVTQRPEVQGMLWPSKLALLLQLPRPILWIGPITSSAAELVRQHPNSAAFAPGDIDAAADWLLKSVASADNNRPTSLLLQTGRENALQKWRSVIEASPKGR